MPDARTSRLHTHRGYLMVSAAALSWGTSGTFLRAAEHFQPIAAGAEVAIVFLTVGVVFGGAAWIAHHREPRPSRAWWGIVIIGVTDGLNNVLYFGAVQRTTLAIAVLTHYMAPLLVAAAAPLVFRTRRSPVTFIALAVALSGLLLLLEPWKAGTMSTNGLGATFGLGSALFYAITVVLTKKFQTWFSPIEMLGYHCAVSGIFGLCIAPRGSFALGAAPVAVLIAQGLLLGGAAGLLFTKGLAHSRADMASILLLLEPVMAVAVAALVWNEVPGPLGAVGGSLILAAAVLVIRAGAEPAPAAAGHTESASGEPSRMRHG